MRRRHTSDIQQSALFEGILPQDFHAIIASLDTQLKYYRKDQTILSKGRRITRFGIVMEGSVRTVESDYWHIQQKETTYQIGDIFAETYACSKNLVLPYTVIANKNAVVLWFNTTDVLKIDATDVSRSILIRNITRMIAEKNRALSVHESVLSAKNTKEKIITYLSMQATIHHSNEFDIPFDRQELADYLSVERSAMSACLSQLSKDGYLHTEKNHFILFDQNSIE